MRQLLKKKGLAIATVVYWFFLTYVVAALVWWFIALQRQNHQMTYYKIQELTAGDPSYLARLESITDEEKRKKIQYIEEGSTFLLLILIVAVFLYRAVRRQIKISQQQQNFMMAVTHELKTPIAVAKLNLETMQRHKLDEARQQKLVQATLQEANRLNALANNILITSQLEAGGYQLSREELDFSLLAESCLQDFHRRFPDRRIEASIGSDIDIKGDPLLLEILVNNLLENAVKYSPATSPIYLSLAQTEQQVTLKVADEGPGIPDNEKKKVFARFYRIGNEQVRTTKGTGLGLYLCKKIAADHNADIGVTNNTPTGSIFAVHFTL
ncbi:MAG: two-component sensor histidine kinase [Bacteroidetes bacterium]|nr:two-component sensor histidine kinase [Bacteroidota bacterium]